MAETGRGWWDEDDAPHEVLEAIKILTSNELRTSTADREANEKLMSQDLSEVLGQSPGAGEGEQDEEVGSGMGGIEYVDVNSVSTDEFERKFLVPGRPCMIRGCADGWPAKEKWASAEALVQHRGDVRVRLTELYNLPRSYFPSAKPQVVRVPLKNFCAYANSNTADFPWYGFDDDFTCSLAKLLEDFTTPRYFVEDCYDASEETRSLFPKAKFFIVGGARTGTGLHVDPSCTSAWNTLLCGRKRWVLFPPGSDDAYMELLGVQEEYSRKGTQPCKWWREDYARVANAEGGLRSKMIECVQGPGETIYVPHGWWHAVLNLDFTVAVTANPLPPASLHSAWGKLRESLTKDTARRFAKQCAEKWPGHILGDLGHLEGEHGNAGVDEKLLAMARGEDEGEEEEEEEEDKDEGVEARHGGEDAAKLQQLRDLGRRRRSEERQRGCVIFFDVDGTLRSQGKEGGLRNEGIAALRELVEATGAEIVLTSRSRVAEATRLAVKASLNRAGLDFTRWVTAAELPGGRASQILDFVTKQVRDQSWAVVDAEGMDEEGNDQASATMMGMVLRSRCVVTQEFGARHALEAANLLLEEDSDSEAEESNN